MNFGELPQERLKREGSFQTDGLATIMFRVITDGRGHLQGYIEIPDTSPIFDRHDFNYLTNVLGDAFPIDYSEVTDDIHWVGCTFESFNHIPSVDYVGRLDIFESDGEVVDRRRAVDANLHSRGAFYPQPDTASVMTVDEAVGVCRDMIRTLGRIQAGESRVHSDTLWATYHDRGILASINRWSAGQIRDVFNRNDIENYANIQPVLRDINDPRNNSSVVSDRQSVFNHDLDNEVFTRNGDSFGIRPTTGVSDNHSSLYVSSLSSARQEDSMGFDLSEIMSSLERGRRDYVHRTDYDKGLFRRAITALEHDYYTNVNVVDTLRQSNTGGVPSGHQIMFDDSDINYTVTMMFNGNVEMVHHRIDGTIRTQVFNADSYDIVSDTSSPRISALSSRVQYDVKVQVPDKHEYDPSVRRGPRRKINF